MRRWNGWGDEDIIYPLPDSAKAYLLAILGTGTPRPDATLEQVTARVPATRLRPHPKITSDPLERVRHARGQSLPDWVAMRSGAIEGFPDGVAYPNNKEDVRDLLTYARQNAVRLIPYGGGTSVVGHINPSPGGDPVLTIDLSRLDRMLELDEISHLATFEAGITGPRLELLLQSHGFTLGHFPQSWEFSTLGGWIATRSSGQQSYYYGRIEQLFAGGHVETPLGPLELPPFPASAAGPDLRECILGSEGRFGVITRAILRVRPLAEQERFMAAMFKDWESGVAAVRALTQGDTPVSMLRLSDAQETETTLVLSGRERLVRFADRGLRLLRYANDRCLLVYALTGDRNHIAFAHRRARSILRAHQGLPLGDPIGSLWRAARFRTPYMRNTLWELGYAIDTLETALPWSKVVPAAAAIKNALQGALNELGEPVLVFAHLSHIYRDGASIYVTFLFRRAEQPEATLQRWQLLKRAASKVIVAYRGTISHQHGVGSDHRAYLASEKGEVGLRILAGVRQTLDPQGLLNPGKLLIDR